VGNTWPVDTVPVTENEQAVVEFTRSTILPIKTQPITWLLQAIFSG